MHYHSQRDLYEDLDSGRGAERIQRKKEAPEMKYTIIACYECSKLVGWELKDRVGGNDHDVPCQLCGKETDCGEYPSNITAAAIRADMN